MKKIILSSLIMMGVLTASAQFEAGTWNLMPRLGGVSSSFTNSTSMEIIPGVVSDNTFAAGTMLGVDLEYQFTNKFSLSAGVGLTQAGCAWEDKDITLKGQKLKLEEPKVETAYFNVPVTANYYICHGLAVHAGLQFGLLTKAEVKYKLSSKAGGTVTEMKESTDVKKEFEKLDIAIPVGLSYQFKTPIVIDLRYNIGLLKVNKSSNAGEKDHRNMIVQLSLGYKFKL